MLEHGGNLRTAALRFDRPLHAWLDLSTGINPHGYPIPPIPREAWQRLPEPNDGLHEAAGHFYGCRQLIATAGSQAAIQMLPSLRPPGTVALAQTSYQEHAHAWRKHGHQIEWFDTEPSPEQWDKADVVVVCSPNNPTGHPIPQRTLMHWHAILNQRGGWLVVDEAFMDTTPEESLAPFTDREGLIVLRSLGKFFGLAGLRVGFLLAHPSLLRRADEQLGPWTVNGPSRLIAMQALLDEAWQSETRQALLHASQRLQACLTQHGLRPHGGTALFQYVRTAHAERLHSRLAEQGIWVRLFKEPLALRFGLPNDSCWEQLSQALGDPIFQQALQSHLS